RPSSRPTTANAGTFRRARAPIGGRMQTTKRRDSLGRVRRPEQDAATFKPARARALSKSHNGNMSPQMHETFARLSPQERGDLIESVLSSTTAASNAAQNGSHIWSSILLVLGREYTNETVQTEL